MKAIHLTAYGHPAQDLRMVDASEPDMPLAGVDAGSACSYLLTRRPDRIAHETL